MEDFLWKQLAHRAVKIEIIHGETDKSGNVGETEIARFRARDAYSLFSKLKFSRQDRKKPGTKSEQ